jgi:hypothetical protein
MRRLNPALVLPALAGLALALSALSANLGGPAVAQTPSPRPGGNVPIQQENKKPGSRGWQSAELSRGRGGKVDEEEGHGARAHPNGGHGTLAPTNQAQPQVAGANSGGGAAGAAPNAAPVWTDSVIRGYADQASINHGGPITFMVSTAQPSYDLEVYRMGWYGGAGSRLITTVHGLAGQNQPVPTPDPTTGLIDANWQPSYTLQTDASWTSGVYLAKLIAASGDVGYIVFVVRADEQQADIVYQLPVNTYSAYNNWGGKSLYDFNSTNSQPAYKVSFDRPYADWDGAGDLFDGDYNWIRWLEKQGYNITYISSVDVQTNPGLLSGRKVFLSPWHDEYWSKPMRDAVTAARDRGMSLAFFDANAVYWQVRFENSPATGAANRVFTCYKDASLDPMATTNPPLTTVQWRQAPVNQPENALLGAMYESYWSYGKSFPWVVQNSSSWVYAGTGLNDGDSIAGLVGYEYDRVWNNGFTPAGEVVLSNSPVTDLNNVASHQNGTAYTAPSGAIVFDAGTVYWSWKLDDNDYQSHGADVRVQTMTANILNKMTGSAPPTPTPTPAGTLTVYGDALASGWVNWSWSSTVNFAATGAVYAGSDAISWSTKAAWGGLYLHSGTAVDASNYTTLSFAAQATAAAQHYSLVLETTGDQQIGSPVLLTSVGGDPVAGAWTYYQIPLAALGAANAQVGGIVIQDESGKVEPVLYVDEIGFGSGSGGGTPTPTPTPTRTPTPTPTKTPTPTPTKPPTSTPTPPPLSGLTVYGDALAGGWVNWS